MSEPLQRSPEIDLGAIEAVSSGALEKICENNLEGSKNRWLMELAGDFRLCRSD